MSDVIYFLMFTLLIICSAFYAYYRGSSGSHEIGYDETPNPYKNAELEPENALYFDNPNVQKYAKAFQKRQKAFDDTSAASAVSSASAMRTRLLAAQIDTNRTKKAAVERVVRAHGKPKVQRSKSS